VSEGHTESRARAVTLFEDRAEVVREARVELGAGAAWLALDGVSPFVDERSVQARLVGAGARVISARVTWRAHLEKALGREEIEALEAEAREHEQRASTAERALDRAERAEVRARRMRASWIASASAAPQGACQTLASWREGLRAIEAASAAALGAAASARAAQQSAERARDTARARLAQGTVMHPRHEAIVEVEVHADEPGPATLEITYRVPCALWRAEHLVRLAAPAPPQGQSAPVEIVTIATAWQRTGERWDDVEVRFSTARPARAASPPLLADEVLASRRKTDEERRRIDVSLRDQAVEAAGLDRGVRAVDEMPGVDDGGEPVLLAPKSRVSIPSDGRPFRVEVARCTLDAKIERVVFPEIAPVAHLRATATLANAGPLLAGPVRVARGQSLVGRAKVGFIGKGEPFEIGLGLDDGVRVRREKIDVERDTTAVIGTQKIKRRVCLFLSNLGHEPKKVLVEERLPVSEIEDVTITLTEPGGFLHEVKDGFLRREVDLGPHDTAELTLGYEIRAAAKVVLPF
jgi:uncharacterized protein (TIGR02231 family)